MKRFVPEVYVEEYTPEERLLHAIQGVEIPKEITSLAEGVHRDMRQALLVLDQAEEMGVRRYWFDRLRLLILRALAGSAQEITHQKERKKK